MKRSALLVAGTLLALALLGCEDPFAGGGRTAPADAPAFRVGGCYLMMPLVKDAVHRSGADRRHAPDFTPGTSALGVRTATGAQPALGLGSRVLTPEQRQTHPALRTHKIGYDALVFAVHPSNPVRSITREKVRSLYTGGIRSWYVLKGRNETIDLLSNVHGGHTHDYLALLFDLETHPSGETIGYTVKHVQAKPTFQTMMLPTNAATVEAVQANPNAMGFLSMSPAVAEAVRDGRIRLLALDGVQPTIESVRRLEYPAARPFFILTNGEPDGPAARVVSYLLDRRGQELVAAWEFVPLGE
jgi:phosphate transport system substrate-binding protein